MNREPIVTVAGVSAALVAVFEIVAQLVPAVAAVKPQVSTLAAFTAPMIVALIARRHTTPWSPDEEG